MRNIKEVHIYSWEGSATCDELKNYLLEKNIAVFEHMLDPEIPGAREQVVVDGRVIGDCAALLELLDS